MLKANRMALLFVCTLLSKAGFADEATEPATGDDQVSQAKHVVETPNAAVQYASLWQPRYPVELTFSPDDWPDAIEDIEFQDGGILARISQLHSLSLLTLAEFGHRRLFLGVNDDGLLGIHFNAMSGKGDQQYFEMIRMPYLNHKKPDSEARQSEPDPN